MKKLTFLLLLFGASIVFSNCKKDNGINIPTYFLNAKINGDSFSTSSVTAILVGPFINITGIRDSNTALSLSIAESLSTGTYPFDIANTDEVAAGYGNSLPGGVAVNAESGSMTITELNTSAKTISGTFEFSGTDANSGDTYNITEGSFNVIYN